MSDDQFTANPSNNSGQDSSQPIDEEAVQDDNKDQKIERSGDQAVSAPASVVEENIDYKDKWLRAQADYSNLVKETATRRSEWAAMSEAQILEEFLPVYDNFCKAFAVEFTANPSNNSGQDSSQPIEDVKKFENWKKGIEYIKQQFWTVLKSHDIEPIETVGKQFDPTVHEAVGQEAVERKAEGEIIKEIETGYRKNGKVVKVAKVIVNHNS